MNSIPHRSPRAALAVAALFTAAGFTLSTGAVAGDPHHTVVRADSVKWGPAPPFLPAGANAAVLAGDPGKEGQFVIRLKFPSGYVIPPHRHSRDELVTVINGKVVIDAGEKVDRSSLKSLPAGSFVNLPAGMAHYARADGEAVVQINGTGPFDITYIDPKDDPRNVAKVSSR